MTAFGGVDAFTGYNIDHLLALVRAGQRGETNCGLLGLRTDCFTAGSPAMNWSTCPWSPLMMTNPERQLTGPGSGHHDKTGLVACAQMVKMRPQRDYRRGLRGRGRW